MILKDLNRLGSEAKAKSLEYPNSETVLSSEFKTEFKKLLLQNTTDNIIFQEYTAVVTTSKGLKIILPNQWFYLASFFYDFLNSLLQYKKVVEEFGISSDKIKEIRGNGIPNEINLLIEAKFEKLEDANFFKKFLTDYEWWFGSKTIDRGDFYISPVLKQAGVINETSSYIASIAYCLSLSNETQALLSSAITDSVLRDVNNIIFYGAPGTGKSHKVKELVAGKEERTERVTFHPEYDYNAFIGGYKPTMNGDDIRYEFVPQAFTNIYVKAWNDLGNDYYLVIEEINRGNCAEIFGDIFQLLDRNSDYAISPSKELKEFLLNKAKGLINEDFGLEGGKLKLPNNLNILATMNTSDQSLFPMDSAFKRRWDWEYIPINYNFSDDNESSKFKVKLSETESFSWLSFILSVNSVIKQNDNLGMDKCLGNYFIKPRTDIIDIKTFINKAIFYLWNDVFKDEMEENNIFLNKTSYEDFFPIQPKGIEKVKEILNILKVAIEE